LEIFIQGRPYETTIGDYSLDREIRNSPGWRGVREMGVFCITIAEWNEKEYDMSCRFMREM